MCFLAYFWTKMTKIGIQIPKLIVTNEAKFKMDEFQGELKRENFKDYKDNRQKSEKFNFKDNWGRI